MCRDCGLEHRTGLDALICDWELGGEPWVRGILARFGVAADEVERTVAAVAAGSATPTGPIRPGNWHHVADWVAGSATPTEDT